MNQSGERQFNSLLALGQTIFVAMLLPIFVGCNQSTSSPLFSNGQLGADTSAKSSLYVASGACYAGGVAVSAGSSTVAVYNQSTGAYERTLVDYNTLSPGDSPVGISDYDTAHLLVTIENASGRRVDLVNKDGSGVSSYLTNSTALNGVLHAFYRFTDGSMLFSKTTAIEKVTSGKARVLQGANPYINAPAGSCATSTTMISALEMESNGKIIYAHAGATPNNKFGLISSTGYGTAADCLNAQTAPNATALPTALVMHPSGNLLVAYGSTTLTSNFIYSYSIDPTANTIGTAKAAFTDSSIVNGISAMTQNPVDLSILVANGGSTYNNVEKFTYDPTANTLTRVGTVPFIQMSVYTRCVSAMKVLSGP